MGPDHGGTTCSFGALNDIYPCLEKFVPAGKEHNFTGREAGPEAIERFQWRRKTGMVSCPGESR